MSLIWFISCPNHRGLPDLSVVDSTLSHNSSQAAPILRSIPAKDGRIQGLSSPWICSGPSLFNVTSRDGSRLLTPWVTGYTVDRRASSSLAAELRRDGGGVPLPELYKATAHLSNTNLCFPSKHFCYRDSSSPRMQLESDTF